MEKTFYSKKTVFDPDYRNVQAELWTLLSDEQQAIVGGSFCHLKNHAQIEIAEALIDFIETGILPDNDSWQNHVTGGIFQFILVKAFPEKVAEILKVSKGSKPSAVSGGFKSASDTFLGVIKNLTRKATSSGELRRTINHKP